MPRAPHCFSDAIRTTLGRLPVLSWNDRDEVLQRAVPLTELPLGARTAGVPRVQFDELAQQVAIPGVGHRSKIDHAGIAVASQLAEFVEHEGNSTAHSRGEVSSGA